MILDWYCHEDFETIATEIEVIEVMVRKFKPIGGQWEKYDEYFQKHIKTTNPNKIAINFKLRELRQLNKVSNKSKKIQKNQISGN